MNYNTLLDSYRIRIAQFQPKQESVRIRVLFFKNRIGSDSKNPLSDHLWHTDIFWAVLHSEPSSESLQ